MGSFVLILAGLVGTSPAPAKSWHYATITVKEDRHVIGWSDAGGMIHWRPEDQPEKAWLVVNDPDGTKRLVYGWKEGENTVKWWADEQPNDLAGYRLVPAESLTKNFGLDMARLKDGPTIRASDPDTLARVIGQDDASCPPPAPIRRIESDLRAYTSVLLAAAMAFVALVVYLRRHR